MVPIGGSVAAAASRFDQSSGLQILFSSAFGVCIVFGPRSVPWMASICKTSLMVEQVAASACSFSGEAEPQADLVDRSISFDTYHVVEAGGRPRRTYVSEDRNLGVYLTRYVVVTGGFVAMVGRCC